MADKLGDDSTGSGGQKPNFTDEQKLTALREMIPALNDIEEAGGVYRAICARWKKAGAPLKALQEIAKERRLDPQEIIAHETEKLRLRAISGRFPTIQQDMMTIFDTAPTDITAKAQEEMDEFRVEDEGYFAGVEGHKIETCPPQYVPGSPFYAAWCRGWHKGQASLVTRMAARGETEAGKKKNGANRGTTAAAPRKRGRPKKGEQPAATA